MRCKEDKAELLKDLRAHLGQLLWPETPEDFTKEWDFFQSEYADQKVWLRYMEDEWLPKKEHWSRLWRKVRLLCFFFVMFNSIGSHLLLAHTLWNQYQQLH